jgi:hypothetical protein
MNSRLLVLAGTVVVLAVPAAAGAGAVSITPQAQRVAEKVAAAKNSEKIALEKDGHGLPPIHGSVDAIPALVLAATASADVSPYQTQATFTVTTPYTQGGQWNEVWTHNYTLTVNPEDGSFAGIGIQYDNNMEQTDTETITGTFAPGSITFAVRRDDDGVSWTLTDATYGAAVTLADVKPGSPIEMKVTNPVFTTPRVWNHGDYVSQTGGGDAARSCVGKPIHINANASHHRIKKARTVAPSLCRREQRQQRRAYDRPGGDPERPRR